jgi:lathosterol oxidase
MLLAMEFAASFAFILVLGYLLPAGQFYYLYHVRQSPQHEAQRIQHRRPTQGQIWREVRMSLVSILIFAIGATALIELYKAGHTSIYLRFSEYPLWYLPVSFALCLIFHDTFFYWSHRFMHWQPVFKHTHAGHHRSISPTPWAIFAFQPAEAIIQFAGIMALVIFLPLHPLALGLFLWWDTIVNTAGHTGFEMVPKWLGRSWLYAGFNTVTHHDTHHTNMKKNFGSFFNVWDRLMGTFQDDFAAHVEQLQQTAALSVDLRGDKRPASWPARSASKTEGAKARPAEHVR